MAKAYLTHTHTLGLSATSARLTRCRIRVLRGPFARQLWHCGRAPASQTPHPSPGPRPLSGDHHSGRPCSLRLQTSATSVAGRAVGTDTCSVGGRWGGGEACFRAHGKPSCSPRRAAASPAPPPGLSAPDVLGHHLLTSPVNTLTSLPGHLPAPRRPAPPELIRWSWRLSGPNRSPLTARLRSHVCPAGSRLRSLKLPHSS